MRITWATDIHLDFLNEEGIRCFGRELADSGAEAIVISGDIGQAPSIASALETLADEAGRPIYFVLGNHDFYLGSVATVRTAMRDLSRKSEFLTWLPESGAIDLGEGAYLVGVDGWGDGRAGDGAGTEVLLNDFLLIEELVGLSREDLLTKLQEMGDAEARHADELLASLTADCERALFATHVPPFVEACWHEGRTSDRNWLPWFTCIALGEVLRSWADRNPSCHVTVLCGHTHSAGFASIASNLEVHTGAAEYGSPRIAGMIETGTGRIEVKTL